LFPIYLFIYYIPALLAKKKNMVNQKSDIREPAVAGAFYSRDKRILERELGMLLEAAPVLKIPRKIRAIISPHAGYLYSGGVAAKAYSQILNANFKRVVIIAPSHEESFNFSSIFDGAGYSTPFGVVPTDRELSQKLISESDQIRLSQKGHSLGEHAIEVQLPFLQSCLGRFKIIPIAMGEQNREQIDALSKVLGKILPADDTIILASSDLSHGHPHEIAKKMDGIAADAINAFDDNMLWREIQEGQTEMCGYGPAIVALKTARSLGAREAKVLLYRNSGDISGDYLSVVGYLSAIIY
jgi:AmmeMemoRadiSam system protein B